MSEYKGVMVFCESAGGKLAPISAELLGIGSKLAAEVGQDLSAVVVGSGVSGIVQEAIFYGACKVYIVDDPLLQYYLTDSYLAVMEKIMKLAVPSIVLLGQTEIGSDLTPRLAFRFNTAATLDCVALAIDPASKRLLQTKPVYGGNAQVIQYCDFDPQIATVRSKTMSALVKDDTRKGEVINVSAGLDKVLVRTRILDRKIELSDGIQLEDALVIVAGGRGIGNADGFKQLEELARLLKGAVGASRPPCDNKWVPDNMQIGLTGKIVSPDLYIAVGLSGSSQHLSGCSGSRVMVAINKDIEANIFKVAHYGIVGDWKKVLPAFTSKVKELVG
jgi:electron transfer flavoprotein alpha subunit